MTAKFYSRGGGSVGAIVQLRFEYDLCASKVISSDVSQNTESSALFSGAELLIRNLIPNEGERFDSGFRVVLIEELLMKNENCLFSTGTWPSEQSSSLLSHIIVLNSFPRYLPGRDHKSEQSILDVSILRSLSLFMANPKFPLKCLAKIITRF